jgi:hypothetical protein
VDYLYVIWCDMNNQYNMISFRGKVIEKTTEAAENLWINYSNDI